MGHGTFDSDAYASFSRSTSGKSYDKIYTSRSMHPSLNPHGVKIRESRDSADNPNSTPIIVGVDVTGSMGEIAGLIAHKGLGVLFKGILDRKPVTDPHIMFMGIGDVAAGDDAPLQVSQFEADNRIIDQLTNIWVEGGGGGNRFESYHLPWYFAAFHTVHDAMEKRGRRGYLFTIGDEETPGPLTAAEIARVTGDTAQGSISAEDLLELVRRTYDVFHIIIAQGSHASSRPREVKESWTKLLGQQAIWLQDYNALAETIVSLIEVREGRDALTSAQAWGGSTAKIVHEAVKGLPGAPKPKLLGRAP